MKYAVLVVHGVGDAGQPGDTVDAFVPSLAAAPASGLQPTGHPEIRQLPETTSPQLGAAGAHLVDVFPVHIRRARRSGDAVAFAEVYWSDLARVGRSTLTLIVGLLYLIFHLRHVVGALLRSERAGGRPAVVSERLLRLVDLLLCGTVAGLNTLLTALLLARLLVWPYYRDHQEKGIPLSVSQSIMEITAALAAAIAVVGIVRSWKPRLAYWGGLLLVSVAMLGLLGLELYASEWSGFKSFDAYLRQVYFPDRSDSYCAPGRFRWHLAAILCAIQWTFLILCFVFAAALAWQAACWAARTLAGRRDAGLRASRASLAAADAATALQVGLWVVIVPTFINLFLQFSPSTVNNEVLTIGPLLAKGEMLAIHLLLLFLLALVGGLTWLERLRRPGSRDATVLVGLAWVVLFLVLAFFIWMLISPNGDLVLLIMCLALLAAAPLALGCLGRRAWEPRQPRLICGAWLTAMLVAIFLANTLVLSAITLWRRPLPDWFLLSIVFSLFLVTLTLGGRYLLEGSRAALHVLMDVVSYIAPQDQPSDAEGDLALRDQIRGRFRAVLLQMLTEETPDHLIVVAHSQGTVIAADVLNERDWWADEKARRGATSPPLRSFTLITMGSPFTHLYQHYFPEDYPPLADARWQHLQKLFQAEERRWRNLYHFDDYVGTEVEPTAECAENILVKEGSGHLDYWRQVEVMQEVMKVFA